MKKIKNIWANLPEHRNYERWLRIIEAYNDAKKNAPDLFTDDEYQQMLIQAWVDCNTPLVDQKHFYKIKNLGLL